MQLFISVQQTAIILIHKIMICWSLVLLLVTQFVCQTLWHFYFERFALADSQHHHIFVRPTIKIIATQMSLNCEHNTAFQFRLYVTFLRMRSTDLRPVRKNTYSDFVVSKNRLKYVQYVLSWMCSKQIIWNWITKTAVSK